MLLTVLVTILLSASTYCFTRQEVDGKPFGYGNTIPVEEVEGFPSVKDFFTKYARQNRPVVMRGANKIWPGFTRWQTDEYFRSVAPEEPYIISLDKKRGNPDSPHEYIDFKVFLDQYNSSRRRMIEFTPEFLQEDVLVPSALDCESITQGEVLMGNKMWFGYNYTTSVVHKDAADNINCLVYGVKNYTIVDPKYNKYVHIDRPDGLYSTMDVDKVNLKKFPGLENVVYQVSELHGGDCMFVPYKWLHQVRSYGRNIAVNVWWNYWKNDEIDLETCPEKTEKPVSIRDAQFRGWGDFETRNAGVQEHFIDLVSMLRGDITMTTFTKLFTVGLDADKEDLEMVEEDILEALSKAFEGCDANGDRSTDSDEIRALPEDRMAKVIETIKYVFQTTRERAMEEQQLIKEEEKKMREENQKEIKKQSKKGNVELDEEKVTQHDEF